MAEDKVSPSDPKQEGFGETLQDGRSDADNKDQLHGESQKGE